ncbi:hypothetical protein L6452_24787 [Arctium lappa]|uniref:Uncharacterized protein n=1 Tax=Arctium lappa TaxID=4217 RepID=A0ACB9AAJ4_ARCLA|nr:hypothetical protein L6452_24787 [Arctium lappa]
MVKAQKCLSKGCLSFLAYVIDAKLEKKKLEDVKVVREFPDVFPDDFPSLPPDRQVEFKIDLTPGAAPCNALKIRVMFPVGFEGIEWMTLGSRAVFLGDV